MAGSKHSSPHPIDTTPKAPLPPVWRMALNLIVIGLVVAYASGLYRPGSTAVTASHDAAIVSEEAVVEEAVGEVEVVELRDWADLSADERNAIKVDAEKQFPELKKMGKDADWKPVTEWLANEKRVATSDTHAIFQ